MDHDTPMLQDLTIPRSAVLLGWLGVVPFAALSLAPLLLGPHEAVRAVTGLVLYAAIILSFMGGAQWGLAMAREVDQQADLSRRLTVSVLPALAAYAMAILPPRAALLGLALVFGALLAYDLATVRAGIAPAWYARLRIQLTVAVVLCLVVAAGLGSA